MTRTRHIATAALALGAVAAITLHTTPADAFPRGLGIGDFGGSDVHAIKSKGFAGSRVNPSHPPLNKFNPNHPSVGLAQDGATRMRPTTSKPNPNTILGSGGRKLPPIGGNLPNPNAPGGNPGGNLPPIGGNLPNPNVPGGKPGGNLPPIGGNLPNPNVPGGNPGGNLPPIGGNLPNPNAPGGNPGGNLPPIGGNLPNPNVPGGNLPPIGGNLPNPNLPWSGNGGGKGPQGHGHGHYGVYVDVGSGGYDPCWWLKRNYHATGRAYWLNRYRFCLWRHFGY